MTNEAILHLRATVKVIEERVQEADDAIAGEAGDALVHTGRVMAYVDCREMLQRILKAIDK